MYSCVVSSEQDDLVERKSYPPSYPSVVELVVVIGFILGLAVLGELLL